MHPLIRLKTTPPLLITLTLLCFCFLTKAQAVVPPPDGGYPGGNTAEGEDALFNLTTGDRNTAIGLRTLYNNTTGRFNTAVGSDALIGNQTSDNNTAIGSFTLGVFNRGNSNTAVGASALFENTIGGGNTATGVQALNRNSSGSGNTANGVDALYHNRTAFFNTAMGFRALYNNTTGLFNTANGYQALYLNETGGSNTANGVQALYRTTGGRNIALGFQAGVNLTTGDNNIDIGNAGVAGDSNKIRIGKQGTHNGTFIAGIWGVAGTGSQVVVNAMGKLGVAASSARLKEAIKPMDKTSEAILALKPVTFRYKEQIDPDRIPQFGLIAEEVEKVNPDLVVRDKDGEPYSVRYDQVNAMLLNEFLKEHRKVEQLKNEFEATVAQQQKEIQALTAQLKAQAAQIQKVSAQIEVTKPAQPLATNAY